MYRAVYRNLNRKHLVLCLFDHLNERREVVPDSIMISVDTDAEIKGEFRRVTSAYKFRDVVLKLYLPDTYSTRF
jgi:hypothetical protein